MPERPIECSHCKKPIKVIYKEIVGKSTIVTEMCVDCPVFQQKLHGITPSTPSEGWTQGEKGLCCGNCRTSLESIKMGNPLGCSECYSIFTDVLISELLASNKISPRIKKTIATKKSEALHKGKSPNKGAEVSPSSSLIALNEALNDALKKENYEQAAWLRDKIKEIMGKNEG
jgi:protein arginine kinase activator